jgi:type II secretory pathway component PulF
MTKPLFTAVLVVVLLTGGVVPSFAADQLDQRASAFVAGAAQPTEAFGETEGLLLLGFALLAVIAIFSLLITDAVGHARLQSKLAQLSETLSPKEGSDA